MLNTRNQYINQAQYNAVAASENHLRRHGASLCDLLDAITDPAGFEALCRLHSAFSCPFPDPDAIVDALQDIARFLADQSLSDLDCVARERNFPASEMARWHGARVSDLISRFRYVG